MRVMALLVDITASARAVAAARIVVGLAAAVKAALYLRQALPVTEPGAFAAPMTGLLPSYSRTGLVLVVTAWVLAAVLFGMGWRTRLVGAALVGVQAFALVVDEQLYSNHLYLLTLAVLLLTWADSGAARSLDARRRGEHATIDGLPVLLAQLMPAVVYGFAAITKLNVYWLSGVILAGSLRTEGILVLPVALREPPWITLLAIATVVLELGLAVLLYRKATRRRAAMAAVGMHVAMTTLISPTAELAVFTLIMGSLLWLLLHAGPIDQLSGSPDPALAESRA